ncbi:MAG: ADP-forming succinate--CoA ligase subunit beta [gamma proteobacterium symbiont of Bathyaustriella thionipta]|nr:ADP-forming succinate--CoA ligase subunit beta [gamma proteobacterium symbiont of Bathyaustriella thionipta]MCU7950243.1 ADP-forming succinate--CoA ligase subunit beta [gamma proteobacterium symbiont of Bathyaustriella thionipta]MCU7953857.1 ADP-forming succinate--CoA ligase subunit beta [gamma proteobacterium symbiont of Bathyaustriella thionipta]MCU7956329.1 ADP-forming succinate--CoA ligase subunit beta [gamma proteobacterium symbiont of Bathyaustriella thionipta]MCU7966747.1 ADP-forming 
MNLHEYQAKQVFADYGIPVPANRTIRSVDEIAQAVNELGGNEWMVKAQVHAGGRGKAGGVIKANSIDEIKAFAEKMLGTNLVTFQTDAQGQPINTLLIEVPSSIARELYMGALVDRASRRVTIMASEAGGMNIEEVAASSPEKIITLPIDPINGLMPNQVREAGFAMNIPPAQQKGLMKVMQGIYQIFMDKDASQVEINPLVVTADDVVMALDAKISLDDNALYRHKDMQAFHDASQEDEKENHAKEFELNYVPLDGDIGCMVNGAGLAMATMDIIKNNGGDPANFLDVGGGVTKERVAEALKLILSDTKVKAILINIFGGIVRCDLIAEGIIAAAKEVALNVPVVVRLEGTNVELGRELLEKSGLEIISRGDFTEAAEEVVKAAASQTGANV